MAFKVIENFLDKKIFESIKEIITSANFPWYYNNSITEYNEEQSNLQSEVKDISAFMFTHNFYGDNRVNSDFFERLILPICCALKFDELDRVKANCYTKTNERIKHKFHVDTNNKHTVGLFSINSNNGYTEFEGDNRVRSLENTMILFEGDTLHRSVTQTDENLRININFNLINNEKNH